MKELEKVVETKDKESKDSVVEWQGLQYRVFICKYCPQVFYTQDSLAAHLTDVEYPKLERSKLEATVTTLTSSNGFLT